MLISSKHVSSPDGSLELKPVRCAAMGHSSAPSDATIEIIEHAAARAEPGDKQTNVELRPSRSGCLQGLTSPRCSPHRSSTTTATAAADSTLTDTRKNRDPEPGSHRAETVQWDDESGECVVSLPD